MKSASVARADDLDDEPTRRSRSRRRGAALPRAPAERTPVREGLPPTYRMRHEPHYVEALRRTAGAAATAGRVGAAGAGRRLAACRRRVARPTSPCPTAMA